MSDNLVPIDHSAFKVSQVMIILLNLLAFILNAPWLALMVTLFMLLGTLLKVPGFGFVYKVALQPLGWIKPHVLPDHPEPHRFAQGFGGVVMAVGSLLLFLGSSALGWGMVWLVTALAALNAFGGFCVGCAVYYWLSRLHVPGFRQSPPPGAFPGMRPKGEAIHDS